MADSDISYTSYVQYLKGFSDVFNKIYFEDKYIGIDEFDPDSFQDIDVAFGYFIDNCHSIFTYLYTSDEAKLNNYWYINKLFEDCIMKYEDVLKYRRNPEIGSIARCKLPRAIIIGSCSRNLLAIKQKLKTSNFELSELELSGNSNSPQLEIELVSIDNDKMHLYRLAFGCLQFIEAEISMMDNIDSILVAFQIEDRPRNTWMRIKRNLILGLLSKKVNIDEFTKEIPEFYYMDNLIKSSNIIKTLADYSFGLDRDYEIVEVLKEAFDQMEIISNEAKRSNSNDLTTFVLENYFPQALLDIIRIMLNVITITGDYDVTQRMIKISGMFHLPNQVNIKIDYHNIYLEMSELRNILDFRYVIIKNVEPINVGSETFDSPRIALVQPKISIDRDYENFQLNSEGRIRHLNIFSECINGAIRQNAQVIIFPEMFYPTTDIQLLRKWSVKGNIIIIAGLDYEINAQEGPINSCIIALPDQRLIRQKKLHRSQYDLPKMSKGERIFVFNHSAIGNFSIFNCIDYLNPEDLVALRGIVDVLFVSALNPDHNHYEISALKDSYSTLYGFVCIANALDPDHNPPIMGKSGLYGPFHGDNKILIEFENSDKLMKFQNLPLNELREAKSGNKSKLFKSLPPAFKNRSLAKDHQGEKIENIREEVNQRIKEIKHSNPQDSKDYEAIRKSNISRDCKLDLKRQCYAILDLKESHTGPKKRLIAYIMIEKDLAKEMVKSIIKIVTEDIKNKEIFTNERQEARHKGKIADVVWLYLFNERRHKRYLNASDNIAYFVCKTQWVRPDIDHSLAQNPLLGDEIIDNIEIKWNSNYNPMDKAGIPH